METHFNLFSFILGAVLIAGVLLVIACMVWESRRAPLNQLPKIKEEVTRINLDLLNLGWNMDQIMEFWEDCMAEAQIRHQLPACSCTDVNQCETWCQVKARFTMSPPEE